MKNNLLLTLIINICIVFSSCSKDSPTKPETNPLIISEFYFENITNFSGDTNIIFNGVIFNNSTRDVKDVKVILEFYDENSEIIYVRSFQDYKDNRPYKSYWIAECIPSVLLSGMSGIIENPGLVLYANDSRKVNYYKYSIEYNYVPK